MGTLLTIMLASPMYSMYQDSKLNPVFYQMIAKGDNDRVQRYISKHPEFLNSFTLPACSKEYFRVPLNVAVTLKQIDVVKTLIAAGANVNLQDDSATPLHVAAEYGNTLIIAALLAAPGVKINSLDRDKKTPLHIAAARGYWRVVELLLRFGANIAAIDSHCHTPLDNVDSAIFDNYCCMAWCCPCYIVHRIYHPEQDYTKTRYLLARADEAFKNGDIV